MQYVYLPILIQWQGFAEVCHISPDQSRQVQVLMQRRPWRRRDVACLSSLIPGDSVSENVKVIETKTTNELCENNNNKQQSVRKKT